MLKIFTNVSSGCAHRICWNVHKISATTPDTSLAKHSVFVALTDLVEMPHELTIAYEDDILTSRCFTHSYSENAIETKPQQDLVLTNLLSHPLSGVLSHPLSGDVRRAAGSVCLAGPGRVYFIIDYTMKTDVWKPWLPQYTTKFIKYRHLIANWVVLSATCRGGVNPWRIVLDTQAEHSLVWKYSNLSAAWSHDQTRLIHKTRNY